MTPQAALIELLTRVGAAHGAAVFISDYELNQWPTESVAAMKAQGLLAKTAPPSRVVCPGCERDCVMSVNTVWGKSDGKTSSFVVCDKRNDTGRVPISADRLIQWQCNAEAARKFIAKSLAIRESGTHVPAEARWEIGIAKGAKRSQMLCLIVNDGLRLVAGDRDLSLLDLVDYYDGAYSLDADAVRQLVDSSNTADKRYTPTQTRRDARKLDTQAMYGSWQKEYRRLLKDSPNKPDTWYASQIAKMDIAQGKSSEYIRKNMK